MIFRIIPRDNQRTHVLTTNTALGGAVTMLGRRISAYIIIKSDDGDRVVDVTSANGDVAAIQTLLENA